MFVCLIALIGGIGVVGVREMDAVHDRIEKIGNDQFATLKLTRQALKLSAVNSRMLMQAFLLRDRAQIDQLRIEREANSQRVVMILAKIELLTTDAQEKKFIGTVTAAREQYAAAARSALKTLLEEHDAEATNSFLVQTIIPNLINYHTAWENFAQEQMDQTDRLIHESRIRYVAARHKVMILTAMAVFSAIWIAVLAFRRLGTEAATRALAQEALRKSNQKLEERVAQRTSELQQAFQSLERDNIERRRLEREILEISEREQCRLGQDLHDGLGQQLAGISLLGKVLANALETEGHALAQTAADIAIHTAETISITRSLAKGLYPIELSRYGLFRALEDLANDTKQRFHIDCEMWQTGPEPTIGKSVEIHLYRIAQESIGNAIKHSRAEHIRIEFYTIEGMHTLSVTDNGIGFEKSARPPSGLGLHLMEYRARLIGAQIEVQSSDGAGCRVICRLPESLIEIGQASDS